MKNITEKEILTIEEIKEKIEHLSISIHECILRTGSSVFCQNRVKRLKLLQSYL